MLNGLPLSEVQRREKRGQIIDYSGQSMGHSPGRPAGLMAAPKSASQDVVQSSAQASRAWASHDPEKPMQKMTGNVPGNLSGKVSMQDAPLPLDTQTRNPVTRYIRFIEGHLARTPWTQGGKLNVVPHALIMGLGIWLPVRLLFGFFAMILSTLPTAAEALSLTGMFAAWIATLFIFLRRIANKGARAN